MTIKKIIDKNLVLELMRELRKVKQAESRFKPLFRKADREQELIEGLSSISDIIVSEAKANIVFGHWRDPNAKEFAREFNYYLEAAIAPRRDLGPDNAGEIEIIGKINSSMGADNGEGYFTGSQVYYWVDKKGRRIISSSIKEILEECGFNTSYYLNKSKKRVPSVLYINLNTPCPDWLGSAGKTHIDLRPYAENIAKVVSSLAYKMPSYYGQGYGSTYIGSDVQKPAIEYLEEFLLDRYYKVKADPSLKHRDPLTQSGVWYRIRPIMIKGGYEPKDKWGKTREYLTGQIDKACFELTDEGGNRLYNDEGQPLEREDLGIHAKARAMMFYEGVTYPVDWKSIEELANKGVFMLVIEKENIAVDLDDYAKGSGIALVHTGGRFTKYVKWLMDKAQVPCAILTDYDYDGVEIAKDTIQPIPRIGIDKDIITWLNDNGYPEIHIENVEEAYTPRGTPDDEYLRHHRIELDSITAAFPDTPGRGQQALWDYVKYRIKELVPEFDYSDIIVQPDVKDLYPEEITKFITKVETYIESIIEEKWNEIEKELPAKKELLSIEDEKTNNIEELVNVVNEDEYFYDKIIPKIQILNEELDELID